MSKYSRNLPVITTVDMPLADTEYSFEIPRETSQILLKLRSQGVILKLAYSSGDIASGNYVTIPQGSSKTLEHMNLIGKTLYVMTASASQTLEVEYVAQ